MFSVFLLLMLIFNVLSITTEAGTPHTVNGYVFDLDSTTGAFLFNAGLARYSGDSSTQGLPSERVSPDFARDHLAALGYLPGNEEELVLTNVGGLAMAVVVICAIIAAMSGVSTAGVVTMGLIALPIMLKKS